MFKTKTRGKGANEILQKGLSVCVGESTMNSFPGNSTHICFSLTARAAGAGRNSTQRRGYLSVKRNRSWRHNLQEFPRCNRGYMSCVVYLEKTRFYVNKNRTGSGLRPLHISHLVSFFIMCTKCFSSKVGVSPWLAGLPWPNCGQG